MKRRKPKILTDAQRQYSISIRKSNTFEEEKDRKFVDSLNKIYKKGAVILLIILTTGCSTVQTICPKWHQRTSEEIAINRVDCYKLKDGLGVIPDENGNPIWMCPKYRPCKETIWWWE